MRPTIAYAGSFVVGLSALCESQARGVVPSAGVVTLVAARAGLCTPIVRSYVGKSSGFEATLDSHNDTVTIASPGGEFACVLRGADVLTASAPCNAMVGGGSARTLATCPASGIRGNRQGDAVHLSATGCHASLYLCSIDADVDVMVNPKRR